MNTEVLVGVIGVTGTLLGGILVAIVGSVVQQRTQLRLMKQQTLEAIALRAYEERIKCCNELWERTQDAYQSRMNAPAGTPAGPKVDDVKSFFYHRQFVWGPNVCNCFVHARRSLEVPYFNKSVLEANVNQLAQAISADLRIPQLDEGISALAAVAPAEGS